MADGYDKVADILSRIEYASDDTHLGIARRITDQLPEYSTGYISRKVSEYRKQHLDDEQTADEAEPDADTWDEWARESDNTGSSESVDYHKRDYYYNDEDDTYVFWVDHSDDALVIDGEVIRSIKKGYSDWTGDVSTINDICRTHGISRRDFVAIKRALGMTHSDSPFTDEQLADPEADISDQLADLAKQQERQLEKSWQKKKWSKTKRDARKWREFKRGTLTDIYESIKATPIDERSYTYADGALSDFYLMPHTTDIHLDQMNADGTGFADNKRRFLDALNQNINRCVDGYGLPQKIVLTLGNDQFNSDQPRGATTAGTEQDQDLIGPDSFFKVADAGVEAIEMCRQVAPVEVRTVPGNHDWRAAQSYYWGLQQRYRNYDEVTLTGGSTKWQYGLYGNNLVVFTHGENLSGGETKRNWSISADLVEEVPELVGQATHRYCMVGHLHHLLEKDDGVHVLQGPSTAKESKWESNTKPGHSKAAQTAYLLEESGGQVVRFTAYVG